MCCSPSRASTWTRRKPLPVLDSDGSSPSSSPVACLCPCAESCLPVCCLFICIGCCCGVCCVPLLCYVVLCSESNSFHVCGICYVDVVVRCGCICVVLCPSQEWVVLSCACPCGSCFGVMHWLLTPTRAALMCRWPGKKAGMRLPAELGGAAIWMGIPQSQGEEEEENMSRNWLTLERACKLEEGWIHKVPPAMEQWSNGGSCGGFPMELCQSMVVPVVYPLPRQPLIVRVCQFPLWDAPDCHMCHYRQPTHRRCSYDCPKWQPLQV